MSVPVPLLRLRAAVDERGTSAYLLTVGDDASPHAVHVSIRWEDHTLVAEVGARSAANAVARPSVSLLFPLRDAGDYSLIVDGTASIAPTDRGGTVHVTPTRAILHRAAVVPAASTSCAADCV